MRTFVGLGSNLGERESMIRRALDELARLPSTTLVRASSLYDTEPVGDPDQPGFLNAVVELETELTARQLLWNLLLIERRLGRVRSRHWGPRVIDLDLLLHGDEVLDLPDLKLPHPELIRRSFVLVPLVELDPLLVHPVTGETMLAHLSRLKNGRPPVKKGSRLWN
jgi:2-amino-4-hydroxy-6-hydroxymethyldihydropteridine diphosphokinase